MSFVTKQLQEEGGEIRLITALEDGKPAWFIMQLLPDKYLEYKKTLKARNGNISDYGQLLESGWGELDESAILLLKQKYPLK